MVDASIKVNPFLIKNKLRSYFDNDTDARCDLKSIFDIDIERFSIIDRIYTTFSKYSAVRSKCRNQY